MQLLQRGILPAVLLVSLAFAGCNLFDGLYEEGSSNDVEVLLADAAMALQRGDYQKAVKILEKAHAANPDNAPVRVDLSNALLRANGITVLDIVNVADNIRADGISGWVGKGEAASCSFPATATVLGEFHYASVEGYEKLLQNEPVFERIAGLLSPLIPPVIDQIRAGEDYDRDALLAAIKSSGLTQYRVDAMLMAYALSVMIDSYLMIFQDSAELTWYHVRGEFGNEYIGYCAASEAAREVIEARAACAVRRLAEAIIALDLRAAHLRNAEGAREVADAALEAFRKLETELSNYDFTCD